MANGTLDPLGAIYALRTDLEKHYGEMRAVRHDLNNFMLAHGGEDGTIASLRRRIERVESLMFRIMGGAAAVSCVLTLAVTLGMMAWRLGFFGGGK